MECQRIKIDLILKSYKSILEFFKEAMVKGYYIYLPVATKFIPCYDREGVYDLFLFGFDDEKEEFYITDYFSTKYSDAVCSFEQLEKACFLSEEDYWYQGFRGCIELVSYVSEKRATFEKWRVKASIEDYLNASASRQWYTGDVMWTKEEARKRSFGIACYQTLFHHIDLAKERGEFFEGARQAFYLMYEHKTTMKLRINYMEKQNHKILSRICSSYEELINDTKRLYLLQLKYNITKEKKILKPMSEICKYIEEKEKIFLEELLISNIWY